jgi:hypothetical protein
VIFTLTVYRANCTISKARLGVLLTGAEHGTSRLVCNRHVGRSGVAVNLHTVRVPSSRIDLVLVVGGVAFTIITSLSVSRIGSWTHISRFASVAFASTSS